MLNVKIEGIQKLVDKGKKLKDDSNSLPERIRESVEKFQIAVVRDSKNKYILKGGKTSPTKVASRSGRLRSAIHYTPPTISGSLILGSVGVLANVKYAPVHEYGFSGTERVRPHVRTVKGRNVYGKVGGKRTKTATGITTVKGFSRYMKIPARPYLKPSITDNMPGLRKNLIRLFGKFGGASV